MKKMLLLLTFFCIPLTPINLKHIAPKSDTPRLSYIDSKAWDLCSLDENFLKMVGRAVGYRTFVETGTYTGATTEKATRYFADVHTIELGKELYDAACKRFKDYKNIFLYHGDSSHMLPLVIKELRNPALFFLDAHFCDGISVKGNSNTPIITEINKIKEAGLLDAFIMVDDTRIFYNPIASPNGTVAEGYPSLQRVIEEILTINPQYTFVLLSDDLLAIPNSDITVSAVAHAATISRLYEEDNFDVNAVIAAEYTISQAQGSEKDAIKRLAISCTEAFSKKFGLSRHYPLWYGLILMAQKNYDEAIPFLIEAKERGLTHWRIDWYLSMARSHCFQPLG